MDTISGKLAAVALALGLLVTSAANPAHAQAPADLAREWSAVQAVLPPGIDAQALLYPAMNATGTLAIQQAAVLGLSPDAYLLAQQHPVQLMDAIQHALRRFDQGAAGIYVAESLCDQVDLLNFNGLTAAQEAQLIALLASEPLASTHLAPSAPAVPAMQPMPVQARRFLLPSSITGPLAGNPRMGTGCGAPCPPLADYFAPAPAWYLPGPQAQALYSYQVRPHLPTKGWVGAIYVVAVYRSAEAARRANLSQMNATRDSLLVDAAARRLPIAQPVNATTEWLRGYLSPVSPQFTGHLRDCYAVAGVRYQNVLMLAQVDNWGCLTPSGYATCQTSYKWTTRVLAALYGRAQR